MKGGQKMKKSKKVARYHTPPVQTAMPKKGAPVFAVASIVFGAIFLFALGLTTYSGLTGYAVTSASSGGAVPATTPWCNDSDGSLIWPQQYFVKGTCIDSAHPGVVRTDFCLSNTTCLEWYCNYQKQCTNISMNCANLNESTGQCSGGACVRKQTSLTGGGSGGASTLSETGFSIDNPQFLEAFNDTNKICNLMPWDNETGVGEFPETFCLRKGYSEYFFVVGEVRNAYFDSITCDSGGRAAGKIQTEDKKLIVGRIIGNFLGYSWTQCTVINSTNFTEPYFGAMESTQSFRLKAARVACCKKIE